MASIDDLLAEARASIRRLDPNEAAAAQAAGAVIVDTRSEVDRTARGWIPGSIPVPRSVLEWRADPTSDTRDPVISGASMLIVVCEDGFSSSLAAANLVRLGHATAADIAGGFGAWVAAGLEIDGGSNPIRPGAGPPG